MMFINPSLGLLAGATLNTTIPKTSHLNDHSPILCYTPAYAYVQPFIPDCQHIITRLMAPASADLTPVVFARRTRLAFTVPKSWRYATCIVSIDVPAAQAEEKTEWGTVKSAATDVLLQCVAEGDRLGGLVKTGPHWGLQVEVRGYSRERGEE